MKKSISVLLASVTCCALLAGCSVYETTEWTTFPPLPSTEETSSEPFTVPDVPTETSYDPEKVKSTERKIPTWSTAEESSSEGNSGGLDGKKSDGATPSISVKSEQKKAGNDQSANKSLALEWAKEINSECPVSRQIMIDFLVSNGGFSTEEATYGADHCGADWKANAKKYAIILIQEEDLTPNYLLSELENMKFTREQAEYGMKNCGANWEQMAASIAREHVKEDPCSYQWLVEALEEAGYTHDQSVKAANQCGADWNANAAKLCKMFLEYYPNATQDELRQFLLGEGLFTSEQTEYGLSHCGKDWSAVPPTETTTEPVPTDGETEPTPATVADTDPTELPASEEPA